MSTQNQIAAVRDKLYSRFNIDTGLELIGATVAIGVILWIASSISFRTFFLVTDKPAEGAEPLWTAALFALISLLVVLPVTLLGLAAWYKKFTVRGIDIGVFITIAITAVLIVLLIILLGDGSGPDYGPLMYAAAVAAVTLGTAAIFAPAIATASLTYRHLTNRVSRRQVLGVTVGVTLLIAIGAGAAYGFVMVYEDRQDTDDGYTSSTTERSMVFSEDWYEENSSVDAYNDYSTILSPREDPYVEEGVVAAASQELPCDSQPPKDVFTGLNETSYGVHHVEVNPSRFWLQTWRHTRDDQTLTTHYDIHHDASFPGYPLSSGMVSNETIVEPNKVYLSWGDRIKMINGSSITIYHDIVTQDGEVVRYGAKLCRPDL